MCFRWLGQYCCTYTQANKVRRPLLRQLKAEKQRHAFLAKPQRRNCCQGDIESNLQQRPHWYIRKSRLPGCSCRRIWRGRAGDQEASRRRASGQWPSWLLQGKQPRQGRNCSLGSVARAAQDMGRLLRKDGEPNWSNVAVAPNGDRKVGDQKFPCVECLESFRWCRGRRRCEQERVQRIAPCNCSAGGIGCVPLLPSRGQRQTVQRQGAAREPPGVSGPRREPQQGQPGAKATWRMGRGNRSARTGDGASRNVSKELHGGHLRWAMLCGKEH